MIILKKNMKIFGVFDGHGGDLVSTHARDYFFKLFDEVDSY